MVHCEGVEAKRSGVDFVGLFSGLWDLLFSTEEFSFHSQLAGAAAIREILTEPDVVQKEVGLSLSLWESFFSKGCPSFLDQTLWMEGLRRKWASEFCGKLPFLKRDHPSSRELAHVCALASNGMELNEARKNGGALLENPVWLKMAILLTFGKGSIPEKERAYQLASAHKEIGFPFVAGMFKCF